MKFTKLAAYHYTKPFLTYIALGLILLGPLLKPGYIFALDMVFTPVLRAPQYVDNSWLFYSSLHWLNLFVPSQLIQKGMLLTIFVLMGLGIHRLIQYLFEHSTAYGQHESRSKKGTTGETSPLPFAEAPAYAAGVFYTVNPFTYDRLMTGQYGVLFGYALLPWFITSLLLLMAKPAKWQALKVAGWAVAVSVVSIHSIGPMIMLGSLLVASRLWQLWRAPHDPKHGQTAILQLAAYTGGALLIFILASSYWLLPALAGHSTTAQTLDSFTSSDRQAFATLGSSAAERLGNVLGLQGFWAEGRGLFRMPQSGIAGWSWLMALVLAVVMTGAVSLWRHKQKVIMTVFGSCIVIGAMLASGIGSSWLTTHLPFYGGYREPQKLAMLIALGYAVFLGFGAQATLGFVQRRVSASLKTALTLSAAAIFLILPFVLTPTMVWSANRQLRAADYPASWYAANQQLNSDTGDNRNKNHFKSLFLPWHLYLYSGFAGRITANPAASFFDKPVIISGDPELKGVALPSPQTDTTTRHISTLLAKAPLSETRLGQDLATLGVKYILVAYTGKAGDFTNSDSLGDAARYAYLDRQTNLTLINRPGKNDSLLIYRNDAYHP